MKGEALPVIFARGNYKVPDYQRGYAWEDKQLNAFIDDIEALAEDGESINSHYTGTLVFYSGRKPVYERYGTKQFPIYDVVDGQQRLTTACLFLSIILNALIEAGEEEYKSDISEFLYSGATCKLRLNNDTENVYFDLLKNGQVQVSARSPHEKRLVSAHLQFKNYIAGQLHRRGDSGVQYLKRLHSAITEKMHFTSYTIEEECEIGMTFELMNSRGKDLSVLELLKNYLMHWVSRNISSGQQRDDLSRIINRSWRDAYINIGLCDGDEDQCLRIAWTLYCNHSPSNWLGYDGFKHDNYIPLRKFTNERTRDAVRDFILLFAEGLAEVSRYYSKIINPELDGDLSLGEIKWLTKIHHAGNIANFLPLLVAARKQRAIGRISEDEHVDLLKSLEVYAFRVFLFSGRRSNAGKSSFFRFGYEVFNHERPINEVCAEINLLTRYYSPEDEFVRRVSNIENWYGTKGRLKYTLFEYELNLIDKKGNGNPPFLSWYELNDLTIEHILPQTPEEGSDWKKKWTPDDISECLHDIGNLVLTQDNRAYWNYEFIKKKGQPGIGPSYCNSDIRQEREIASYPDWTRDQFNDRRKVLVDWISSRWKTVINSKQTNLFITDEADEDSPAKAIG